MVERMVRIHEVRGSIPLISTNAALTAPYKAAKRISLRLCSLINYN